MFFLDFFGKLDIIFVNRPTLKPAHSSSASWRRQSSFNKL